MIMQLKWTHPALSDLKRLYEFLSPVNPRVAGRIVRVLTEAPSRLLENPRMGQRLHAFSPREVRHIFVGDYEMRYEIQAPVLHILRIWHTREYRY